jgi:hypothetical protein
MYSFYIYIGSTWTEVYPDASNASAVFGREVDSIRYRKNIDGEFKFIGADYDLLKTALDGGATYLLFKATKGLTILCSGALSLFGKWDTGASVCSLKYLQSDEYTKILNKLDQELDLMPYMSPVHPDIVITSVEHTSYESKRYVSFMKWVEGESYIVNQIIGHNDAIYKAKIDHESTSLTEPGVGGGWTVAWDLVTEILAEDEIFQYYSFCSMAVSSDGWLAGNVYKKGIVTGENFEDPEKAIAYSEADQYADNFVLHSGSWYFCNQSHTAAAINEPGSGAQWPAYWVAVVTPQIWVQERGKLYFTESVYDKDIQRYVRAPECHATTGTYVIGWAGLPVKKALQALLADIDTEITVDDWFPYLSDNYTDTINLNIYLKTWYPISIPHPDKEPSIKLSQIIDFLKAAFRSDWRLEDGDFVFRHASERPTVASFDGTDLLSLNWTILEFEHDESNNINEERWKFGKAQRPDFQEVFFKYPTLFSQDNDKRIASDLNTDFDAYMREPEGHLIYCSDRYEGVNELEQYTGLLSEVTENNGTLALTILAVRHWGYNTPFPALEDWTGNDEQGITLAQKRTKKVTINAPLRDFEDFDPETELIETDLADLEAVKILIPLSGGVATIETVW